VLPSPTGQKRTCTPFRPTLSLVAVYSFPSNCAVFQKCVVGPTPLGKRSHARSRHYGSHMKTWVAYEDRPTVSTASATSPSPSPSSSSSSSSSSSPSSPSASANPKSAAQDGKKSMPDGWADFSSIADKEMARRMKISAANRGRTPWNKGRNLTREVREKIRQRTFEAMQRPDVRARMAEANQHRLPHSEAVKQRIRDVLREKVALSKEQISQQTLLVLEDMKKSNDPEERRIGECPAAADVISRAAWRYLKRDFGNLHEKWLSNHNDFRKLVISRFLELEEREKKKRRRKPRSSQGKVARALATQKKLSSAREKLAMAESTLKKVAPIKAQLQANPDANPEVLHKVMEIESLVTQLRSNVVALNAAMAPLEQYLSPDAAYAYENKEAAEGL
jgi:hypothetical protein